MASGRPVVTDKKRTERTTHIKYLYVCTLLCVNGRNLQLVLVPASIEKYDLRC